MSVFLCVDSDNGFMNTYRTELHRSQWYFTIVFSFLSFSISYLGSLCWFIWVCPVEFNEIFSYSIFHSWHCENSNNSDFMIKCYLALSLEERKTRKWEWRVRLGSKMPWFVVAKLSTPNDRRKNKNETWG